MSAANQQGDPSVDSIVERAAKSGALPTADHNTLYNTLLTDLQHELDADLPTVVGGGS